MSDRRGVRLARRLGGWLRDGWLVVGATLALLVVIELAYRGARTALRPLFPDRLTGMGGANHPYARERWFAPWEERRNRTLHDNTVYDPYRGYRLTAASLPGLHVDSAGHRVTVQRARAPAARRLVLLGGSTMWGYNARDSLTIPSLVAARLAARGIHDVEVVNLAEVGYNLTQGVATLLLELRRGRVPAAVVSLDGVNEVDAVLNGGRPGEITDQRLAERRFARRGPGAALLALGESSRFLRRVARLAAPARPPAPSPERACPAVAAYYGEMARVMGALGREYGFPVLLLWQPTLARSRKPRTAWEASLADARPELQRLTVRCSALTDSLLSGGPARTYFPLHSLFDRDTATVFLDHFGHVTERANGVIADRAVELVAPLLASAP